MNLDQSFVTRYKVCPHSVFAMLSTVLTNSKLKHRFRQNSLMWIQTSVMLIQVSWHTRVFVDLTNDCAFYLTQTLLHLMNRKPWLQSPPSIKMTSKSSTIRVVASRPRYMVSINLSVVPQTSWSLHLTANLGVRLNLGSSSTLLRSCSRSGSTINKLIVLSSYVTAVLWGRRNLRSKTTRISTACGRPPHIALRRWWYILSLVQMSLT